MSEVVETSLLRTYTMEDAFAWAEAYIPAIRTA